MKLLLIAVGVASALALRLGVSPGHYKPRSEQATALAADMSDDTGSLTLDEMVDGAGGAPAVEALASDLGAADDVADSVVLGADPWAPELTEDEVKKIHEQADAIFSVIDLNADGAISLDELDCHLSRCGYTEEAVAGIFDALDCDGDVGISREELRKGFVQYAPLRSAPGLGDYRAEFIEQLGTEADTIFNTIDVNGDGLVSLAELQEHLAAAGGVNYEPQAVDKIFRTLDGNADGSISQEEMRIGYVRYAAMRIALGWQLLEEYPADFT